VDLRGARGNPKVKASSSALGLGELSDASSVWWTFGTPSGDPTFARGGDPQHREDEAAMGQ